MQRCLELSSVLLKSNEIDGKRPFVMKGLQDFIKACTVLLTLQMFCLLKPQMNACEPNPKTTSSDFNSLESVTKIFCFHAISKDICLLF